MSNPNQISCQMIISGGQTGVDRGALDAAIELYFPCGGWCPKGKLAEDGIIPEKYPLKEMINAKYSDRTKKNVLDSDGTLIIFNKILSGGTLLTHKIAKQYNKPVFLIDSFSFGNSYIIENLLSWINEGNIKILNVAGPRISEWEYGYINSKKIVSSLIGCL